MTVDPVTGAVRLIRGTTTHLMTSIRCQRYDESGRDCDDDDNDHDHPRHQSLLPPTFTSSPSCMGRIVIHSTLRSEQDDWLVPPQLTDASLHLIAIAVARGPHQADGGNQDLESRPVLVPAAVAFAAAPSQTEPSRWQHGLHASVSVRVRRRRHESHRSHADVHLANVRMRPGSTTVTGMVQLEAMQVRPLPGSSSSSSSSLSGSR